jgi:uncharacterized protein YjbI with pentapeptide repeats
MFRLVTSPTFSLLCSVPNTLPIATETQVFGQFIPGEGSTMLLGTTPCTGLERLFGKADIVWQAAPGEVDEANANQVGEIDGSGGSGHSGQSEYDRFLDLFREATPLENTVEIDFSSIDFAKIPKDGFQEGLKFIGSYTLKVRVSNCALSGFDLRSIAFSDIRSVSFQGAKLQGAQFCHLNITAADFTGADLSNACFKYLLGEGIYGCNFEDAILRETRFRGHFTNCTFSNDLTGANFSESTLHNVTFDHCHLRGAKFDNCDFSNVDFSGHHLTDVSFAYAEKSIGSFPLAIVFKKEVNLNETTLAGVNFTGCDLRNMDFSNQELNGAIFKEALITGVNFQGAKLRGADLSSQYKVSKLEKDGNWYKEVANEVFDLSGADLTGAKLTGRVISRKHLVDTVLTGADLSYSVLAGHDFSDRDLTGTIFKNTVLTGTNLRQARTLKGISLFQCDLQGQDFSGLDLEGANLSRAKLTGVSLSGAVLRRADLSYCDLSGRDFSDHNLTGTDFGYSNLNDVSLERATLRGSSFSGCDLSKLKTRDLSRHDLTGVCLMNAILGDIILPKKLRGVKFRKCDLVGRDFSECDLTGADLHGAKLTETCLDNAILKGIDFSHCELDGRNFAGCDLSGTNFLHAKLKDANFRGANLNGANFIGADLDRADLRESYLSHANLRANNLGSLRGCILIGATLPQDVGADPSQLEEAILYYADAKGHEFSHIPEERLCPRSYEQDVRPLLPEDMRDRLDVIRSHEKYMKDPVTLERFLRVVLEWGFQGGTQRDYFSLALDYVLRKPKRTTEWVLLLYQMLSYPKGLIADFVAGDLEGFREVQAREVRGKVGLKGYFEPRRIRKRFATRLIRSIIEQIDFLPSEKDRFEKHVADYLPAWQDGNFIIHLAQLATFVNNDGKERIKKLILNLSKRPAKGRDFDETQLFERLIDRGFSRNFVYRWSQNRIIPVTNVIKVENPESARTLFYKTIADQLDRHLGKYFTKDGLSEITSNFLKQVQALQELLRNNGDYDEISSIANVLLEELEGDRKELLYATLPNNVHSARNDLVELRDGMKRSFNEDDSQREGSVYVTTRVQDMVRSGLIAVKTCTVPTAPNDGNMQAECITLALEKQFALAIYRDARGREQARVQLEATLSWSSPDNQREHFLGEKLYPAPGFIQKDPFARSLYGDFANALVMSPNNVHLDFARFNMKNYPRPLQTNGPVYRDFFVSRNY